MKKNDSLSDDVEKKSPEVVAEIYKQDDKYYCAECHSELPIKQDCPICKKKLDWDRIMFERRPY